MCEVTSNIVRNILQIQIYIYRIRYFIKCAIIDAPKIFS